MHIDELLHPVPLATFLADYVGRKPLHIPAGDRSSKSAILNWSDFNRLLGQTTLWRSDNLLLMRNYVAVPPEQYCHVVATPSGDILRPWPQKVEVFLSCGASLIANDVMPAHAPLMDLGEVLSRVFAARVSANLYCSFQGVRAFGTHFDNHDVIVVQTEGSKVWNLYENRADNPVKFLPDDANSRLWFEQTRGALMTKITLRAGDVLYVPRGWYHDALATDGPSLHVTFSISPMHGQNLLAVLNTEAMKDPEYRAYVPPAEEDGGAALTHHLSGWAQLLARVATSPAFREEVAKAQACLTPRPSAFALPERKPLTVYSTTGHAFPDCSAAVREIYDWAIIERRFAIEDMIAQFQSLTETDIRAAVAAADQAGAIARA